MSSTSRPSRQTQMTAFDRRNSITRDLEKLHQQSMAAFQDTGTETPSHVPAEIPMLRPLRFFVSHNASLPQGRALPLTLTQHCHKPSQAARAITTSTHSDSALSCTLVSFPEPLEQLRPARVRQFPLRICHSQTSHATAAQTHYFMDTIMQIPCAFHSSAIVMRASPHSVRTIVSRLPHFYLRYVMQARNSRC